MLIDPKRRVELHICAALIQQIQGLKAYPTTGFELNSEELFPPFVVVTCLDLDKKFSTQETYLATMLIQYFTHGQDSRSEDHSTMVKAIYNVLVTLPAFVSADYVFHGPFDVDRQNYSDDATTELHVDNIRGTCGITA